MQQAPDYSEYTLRQLRQIIRNHAYRLSPEQYTQIATEIQRREVARRPYLQPPADASPETPTLGFKISRAIAMLQYGAVFVLGFVWPIGYQIIVQPGTDMPVHLMLVPIAVLLLTMTGIGLYMMRYRLRYLRSPLAVRQWSFVAAIVAPFSAFAYGAIFGFLLKLLNSDSDFLLISNVMLGFYMPFILITVWLKYKYRTDEF